MCVISFLFWGLSCRCLHCRILWSGVKPSSPYLHNEHTTNWRHKTSTLEHTVPINVDQNYPMHTTQLPTGLSCKYSLGDGERCCSPRGACHRCNPRALHTHPCRSDCWTAAGCSHHALLPPQWRAGWKSDLQWSLSLCSSLIGSRRCSPTCGRALWRVPSGRGSPDCPQTRVSGRSWGTWQTHLTRTGRRTEMEGTNRTIEDMSWQ